MSLLDAFYILFQSDADKTSKDVDKLNTSLKQTENVSSQLSGKFNGVVKSLLGIGAAVFSVSAVLAGISSSNTYADELGKLSKRLNISVTDLDAWSSAVEKNGGSAQSFQSTLSSLNEKFASVGRYGQNTTQYLLRVSSAMERMSSVRAQNFGKSLGLDESTIDLLSRGRKSVEELINKQKELSEITKKDTEIARKFKEQWHDTTKSLSGVFTGANSYLIPFFTKVLKVFEDFANFLRRHRGIVEGALIAIGSALGFFAVRLALASLPLTLITAGIILLGSAFSLAYDDIKTFIEGGDSLYGRLITKYPVIHEIIKSVGEQIKNFWETLKWSVGIVNEALVKTFEVLLGWLSKIAKATTEMIKGIKEAAGKVGDFFSVKDSKTENVMKSVQDGQVILKNISESPISSQPSTTMMSNMLSNSNKNITTNVGDITINTNASSSEDIAKTFDDNLKKQIIEANNNYTDGLLA